MSSPGEQHTVPTFPAQDRVLLRPALWESTCVDLADAAPADRSQVQQRAEDVGHAVGSAVRDAEQRSNLTHVSVVRQLAATSSTRSARSSRHYRPVSAVGDPMPAALGDGIAERQLTARNPRRRLRRESDHEHPPGRARPLLIRDRATRPRRDHPRPGRCRARRLPCRCPLDCTPSRSLARASTAHWTLSWQQLTRPAPSRRARPPPWRRPCSVSAIQRRRHSAAVGFTGLLRASGRRRPRAVSHDCIDAGIGRPRWMRVPRRYLAISRHPTTKVT